MLLTKIIKVKWNPMNKKQYESKGYVFTKYKDEFDVKVEDLSDGCNEEVEVQCDECGKVLRNIKWNAYKKYAKKDEKYYCNKCAIKLYGGERKRLVQLKNGESFGYWLIKNLPLEEATEIIARWDEEKNGKDIREVSYASSGFNKKGYWFKCSRDLHSSELKRIADFTRGQKGSLKCNACNSIGQYIIDMYGEHTLNKYWDWKKNSELGLNPWKINKSSKTEIHIFCQIHSYHESYFVSCNSFTKENGVRCPYCNNNNKKVHRFDSLGYLYTEVFDIWSEKNKKSPYEYAPKSDKKVWWKCPDGKHDDYYRTINSSNACNFRCPECVQERTESILQEKVRLYLESLGYNVLHEYKCTIVPINPKTKNLLPFDNEILLKNGKHLICEVHGRQHYALGGFHIRQANCKGTTPEYEFHMQKVRDRYKRMYAKSKGYEYLEIPFNSDNKKKSYKKSIDDKINEILNKPSTKAS